MSRRWIRVSTWGAQGRGKRVAESFRVRAPEEPVGAEDVRDAVEAALARRAGADVICCGSQGTRLENGRAAGRQYEATFGTYDRAINASHVRGSIWFEIEVSP